MHSSDWHLGRRLYGQSRDDEFEAFLTWLLEEIQRQAVDVLLLAGDIFDINVPSNRAQQLYYQFLRRIGQTQCRHVVVIAGNHDSPSFLDAPQELLKALNIHVVGSKRDDIADELVCIYDDAGQLELLVAAVPYLRDRDVRSSSAGESYSEAAEKLKDGVAQHYQEIAALAALKRQESGRQVPIIGMGHLFTEGGLTVEGDGVRELHVGTLAQIESRLISQGFDYLALGHLHVPQIVAGNEMIAYCGSPLAMGFNEAGQQKSLRIIEFQENAKPGIEVLPIPVWQKLEPVQGDWPAIAEKLLELKNADVDAWLEIVYESDELCVDLREKVHALLEGTRLLPLRIINKQVTDTILQAEAEIDCLQDMDHEQVFQRRLEIEQLPAEQQEQLFMLYQNLLRDLLEEDQNK